MSLSEEEKETVKNVFFPNGLLIENDLEPYLPETIYNFLKNQKNLSVISDRFLYRKKNFARPYESIIISKFLVPDFDIYLAIDTVTQAITSEFLIFIDFDFIIECNSDKKRPLKFEFAAKTSCLNENIKITSGKDQVELMKEFKNKSYSDFLSDAFVNHRDLHDYGKSDFRPHQLLSLKIYLQLFPRKK